MSVSVCLSGVGDVVAALPFLLGFEVADSVVVAAVKGSGRLGVVARGDLPGPGDPAGFVAEMAGSLVLPVVREGAAGALVVGVESVEGASAAVAAAVGRALAASGVPVAESVVVRGGRWWSASCRCGDPVCCPAEGTAVGVSAAAAEFVGLGVAPLAGRGRLAEQLAPTGRAVEVGATCDRLGRVPVAAGLAGWGQVLASAPDAVHRLPAEVLAAAAGVLADLEVRDVLVAWLTPGTLPLKLFSPALLEAVQQVPVPWRSRGQGDGSRQAQHAVAALCANLPDAHAAPALTVLASLAWWRGDGAAARVALDRARTAAPGYPLADLLTRLVDLGIRL